MPLISPKQSAWKRVSAVVKAYEGDPTTNRGRNRGAGPPRPAIIFAKLTANSQDGSNKRWSYSFTEVEKTSAGYGGWTTKSGGITGTAYNLMENMNAATGLWGNGVNSGNLAGTSLTIQPIPTNEPVELKLIALTDGTTEYWFSAANAIDGSC